MKREGEKIDVSGEEFIKISRLTSDFSNLNQVKNFWLHNITDATAKVLASHFNANNPQNVIVEECSAKVCKILFTPRNFARTSALDLINLNPEAASRAAAVLPFSRIVDLVLEVLSVEAIDRIGTALLNSKLQEVWLDRLTPEATLKAVNILSKSKVTEIHADNITEETAIRIGGIYLQPRQTITILLENAEEVYLCVRDKRIPGFLADKAKILGVKIPEEGIPPPVEDEQSLITRLTQHNVYLQSVIDRQFTQLIEQQQFIKTNISSVAQMPFFQHPDNGSKKRKVENSGQVPPSSALQNQVKR